MDNLESRIERYKAANQKRNYIMLEKREIGLSKGQPFELDSFSIIDLNTPIDWKTALDQHIKRGQRILHVNLPLASDDDRVKEANSFCAGLMGMMASVKPSPAEIKTSDKMGEVKARLGRPKKEEAKNEQ